MSAFPPLADHNWTAALECVPGHQGARAMIPAPLPTQTMLGPDVPLVKADFALMKAKAVLDRSKVSTSVLDLLRWEEAVFSSRIEGIRNTLRDYLSEGASDPKNRATIELVHHCYLAQTSGLSHQEETGLPVSQKLIRFLHAILMEGKEWIEPGEYRGKIVWIGGATPEQAGIIPPLPERLKSLMKDLEYFIEYPASGSENIFKLAMTHAQFQLIHPFRDGNGRIGRMMIPAMAASAGYLPVMVSRFLFENRETYYALLGDARKGARNAEEWLKFFASAVTHFANRVIAVSDALGDLPHEYAALLKGLRADAAAHELPRVLFDRPTINVKMAAAHLGITFQAATRAVKQLQERGILFPVGANLRNRMYEAPRIYEILDKTAEAAMEMVSGAQSNQ